MHEAEQWLAAERKAAGACPRCGVRNARPIVYGMPDFVYFEDVHERVVFFGCCLPEVRHRWSCASCETTWGELRSESSDLTAT